jgi:RNA-binding protein
VPASQSPKKRSLMPSSPLRRRLRAAGHHLSPVVQVGKEGVTDAVLRQVDRALQDHELVKVKVGSETPDDRFGSAEALLAGSEGAGLVQILGRTLLLYRRHPEKPRFEPLPARAVPPAPRAAPRPAPRAGARPAPRTERWSGQRAERRPGPRTERRPAERTERRPGPRTERQPPQRTGRRPGQRTERRPGQRTVRRTDRRTERPSGPRRPTRR